MRKILYITNIPAPYTVSFFNELGKKYNLTVAFEGNNATERDRSWTSFSAIHFKYTIINKEDVNPLRFSAGIIKILRKNQYDFYIVGNYSSITGMLAIIWLRRHKYPYAIHADGGMIGSESIFKYHVKRYFLRDANLYFSSGRITTDYFIYYGAVKEHVFEYPFSSVRQSQICKNLDSSTYKEKLGIPIYQKTIVSVGQIIPRKGFDVLIKALSVVNTPVKLYIIGGEASDELETLVNELCIDNVEFLPFLPFDTILDYMAAADVFVLLTREDIWGLVINEAMSMGTPIISTNKCVAAVEMIENNVNGYIVESEDFTAAAKYIEYILGNEALCREIRKNNVKKAKKYTIETMADSYAKIIDKFFIK